MYQSIIVEDYLSHTREGAVYLVALESRTFLWKKIDPLVHALGDGKNM